jgi:DNA-binding NarL/FixJ family response regulator
MQDNLIKLPARDPTEPERSTPNNLPAQLTPLIGREQELAAACTLLHHPEVRLLTLSGTGGTGKTRLSVQIAADLMDLFPDGVYFVNLAAARAHLGEKPFAAAWAQGRTMTPEQALAAQGQPILPTPSPAAKPAATSPDRLTAREVEVLHLLAQGLTDAQIAEQLVISPRTVNNHLTSIYGKIRVSSRSAATRYAIEHQFV